MAQAESEIQREIQLLASERGHRLFRNNVAEGWIGASTRYDDTQTVVVNRGDVVIRNARRLHSGLGKGSADLIGFTCVDRDSLPEGLVPVFSSIEIKSTIGAIRQEQADWQAALKRFRCIAEVCRSRADYEAIIA